MNYKLQRPTKLGQVLQMHALWFGASINFSSQVVDGMLLLVQTLFW